MLEGEGRALKHGETFHAVDGRGEFMCSFLVEQQTVFSAYPYVERGADWPVRIREIVPGPSPLEGHVVGDCRGLPCGFFDTLHFRNRALYEGSSGPYDFSISALALDLRSGGNEDSWTPGDALDEWRVTATVTGVTEISFWDLALTRYTLEIPTPAGEPLQLPLYTPHAAQEQAFACGDRVQGEIWLFGQVPPLPDDAAAQAEEGKV